MAYVSNHSFTFTECSRRASATTDHDYYNLGAENTCNTAEDQRGQPYHASQQYQNVDHHKQPEQQHVVSDHSYQQSELFLQRVEQPQPQQPEQLCVQPEQPRQTREQQHNQVSQHGEEHQQHEPQQQSLASPSADFIDLDYFGLIDATLSSTTDKTSSYLAVFLRFVTNLCTYLYCARYLGCALWQKFRK